MMHLDLRARERRALDAATLTAIETDAGYEIYSTGRLLHRWPDWTRCALSVLLVEAAMKRLAEIVEGAHLD